MPHTMNPVDLTRKLLSFNTINPPGHERNCAEYLGGLLEDRGFKVSYYEFGEKRTNLIALLEGRGDRAPICFTGHIDTVPLGETEWRVDPFDGEIDGDKIYGRGASDMKGGLAAMVIAALSLADEPLGKAGMSLVITAGEESACQGAAYLAGLENVLGEAGALVVAEPTSNIPFLGHKGAMGLQVVATGITAHGSMPQEGVNAIYKAAEAVIKLRDYHFDTPSHPWLGSPTLILGPGEQTMAHKSDEYCYISKIETATEAYLKIAKKWCRL